MCFGCEMREINILRHRMAARTRERMRAEAVETAEPRDESPAPAPGAPDPHATELACGVNV